MRIHKEAIYLSLLSVLTSLHSPSAELIYDELPWLSSTCVEQGYTEGHFEFCAILEFCEGDGDFSGYNNGNRNMESHSHHAHRGLQQYPGMEGDMNGADTNMNMNMNGNASPQYGEPYNPYSGQSPGGDTSDTGPRPAKYGWRIGGSSTCTSPGPIIRLKRGTSYGLFVQGSTNPDTVTNLHTHGLHIAGTGNADDVTRTVAGGDVVIYNLTIPEYHMGGTYFYHSHRHGAIQEHIGGGAFGMIIVDDGEDIGTIDENVLDFMKNEKVLVIDNIQDKRFAANGHFMGETYTFNKYEWYRLRILLVSVDAYKSGAYVSFGESCTVHALSHDGILTFNVPSQEPKSSYFLTAASRLDVAIQCQDTAEIMVDQMPLARITVSDPQADSDTAKPNATPFEGGMNQWASTRPPYLADLSDMLVADSWTVNVYETSINNVQFDLDSPLCNSRGGDFEYDTVNEWTLKGTYGHPLHVHMYPMQVVSGCGEEHERGEFYDTVVVQKQGFEENDDTCVVRLRFVDIAGHAMMHCHILLHEDQGSMGFINVIGGPEQPVEPRVLRCANGGTDGCDPLRQTKQCSSSSFVVPENMMPNEVEGGDGGIMHDMNMNNGADTESGTSTEINNDGGTDAQAPVENNDATPESAQYDNPPMESFNATASDEVAFPVDQNEESFNATAPDEVPSTASETINGMDQDEADEFFGKYIQPYHQATPEDVLNATASGLLDGTTGITKDQWNQYSEAYQQWIDANKEPQAVEPDEPDGEGMQPTLTEPIEPQTLDEILGDSDAGQSGSADENAYQAEEAYAQTSMYPTSPVGVAATALWLSTLLAAVVYLLANRIRKRKRKYASVADEEDGTRIQSDLNFGASSDRDPETAALSAIASALDQIEPLALRNWENDNGRMEEVLSNMQRAKELLEINRAKVPRRPVD